MSAQEKRKQAKVERLNAVGRAHFELEEYVSRCRLARRAPTLGNLETLLHVVEPSHDYQRTAELRQNDCERA